MGFKVFSYEYFENNFAATKFALGAIGTPNYAPHHNTAGGTDTPGLDDTGVDAFSAGYVDYREADVPMIIGTTPTRRRRSRSHSGLPRAAPRSSTWTRAKRSPPPTP